MAEGRVQAALVTGGAGLTGRALVDALLARGTTVRVLDLVPYPDARVETVVGDVRDPAAAARACVGVDTVFHTVAIVSQHPKLAQLLEAVNVGGTRTTLEAARANGVQRYVFTSSIDVVFDGTDIANGDERLPYPRRHLDDYGRTKMDAERLVLSANRPGFSTCSLRSAGIFGPFDQHRLPVVLDYARRNGFIPLGDGRGRFSHVFVENLAHAHVLAAEALREESNVAGNKYFITDHEPTNFADFVEPYLAAVGIPRRRALPEWIALPVALAVEGGYGLFGRWIRTSPVLTRYTVAAVCRDFWFNHEAATRDFGYRPIVSANAAYQKTLDWFVTLS